MGTYNTRVGHPNHTLDAYLLEVRAAVYNFRDVRSMNRCPRQECLSARPRDMALIYSYNALQPP